MIVTDLIRAALLLTLVAIALSGHASIAILIVIALGMSVCNTFFDVSYQSFVPHLVQSGHLVEANSKLEATRSVAMIGGPALGGLLLRYWSAANLLGATVVTYLISAASLSRIRNEEVILPPKDRAPLIQEIRSGLTYVLKHRVLSRIVFSTALGNLFMAVGGAVYTIYALRYLGMSTQAFGIVVAVGSVGGLLGALVADRVTNALGHMRALPLTTLGFTAVEFLDPLAAFTTGIWVPVLLTGTLFIGGFFMVVYNIAQVSYRQRVCPPKLLGRMNASVRFIIWGVVPIGGLAGGYLGGYFGVWPIMWVAAVGGTLSVLPLLPALWHGFEEQNVSAND